MGQETQAQAQEREIQKLRGEKAALTQQLEEAQAHLLDKTGQWTKVQKDLERQNRFLKEKLRTETARREKLEAANGKQIEEYKKKHRKFIYDIGCIYHKERAALTDESTDSE